MSYIKQNCDTPIIVVKNSDGSFPSGDLTKHSAIVDNPTSFVIVSGNVPDNATFLIYDNSQTVDTTDIVNTINAMQQQINDVAQQVDPTLVVGDTPLNPNDIVE